MNELLAFEPRCGRWEEWQDVEPALAGRGFAAVRRELLHRSIATEHKDAVLAALVRRSNVADDTEARVATVTCLMPGLLSVAGRFVGVLGRHDAIAEALASLWIELDRIDVATRSDRIAARLLAGVRHHLERQASRERAWWLHRVGEFDMDGIAAPLRGSDDVRVLTAAVDAGVLQEVEAVLIEATRLRGLRLADTASLLGLSYDAAKKRRRRAEAVWFAWHAPARRRPVSGGAQDAA